MLPGRLTIHMVAAQSVMASGNNSLASFPCSGIPANHPQSCAFNVSLSRTHAWAVDALTKPVLDGAKPHLLAHSRIMVKYLSQEGLACHIVSAWLRIMHIHIERGLDQSGQPW